MEASTDYDKMSMASIVRSMSPQQQREFIWKTGLVDTDKLNKKTLREIKDDVQLGFLDFLEPAEKAVLRYSWRFWARPNQIVDMADDSWTFYLFLMGRGSGKTRAGAEWVRELVESSTSPIRVNLIGPTASDARDVMVRGDSGILAVSPPWLRAEYSPSNRRVTWANGCVATLFSAEEPERLRGPQAHYQWCDELCSWKQAVEVFDMSMMGLRLGERPRTVITTTPKPTPLLKTIIADKNTKIVTGSTYDNKDNLAPTFIKTIIQKYEGTDLGRQELHAELLLENKNALWSRQTIGATRVSPNSVTKEQMVNIVVAVDPPASSSETSDECGIVVCGRGVDGHGYVLADLSARMTPKKWAQTALQAHRDYQANSIVAERNNGGEMVKHTIKSYNEDGLKGDRVHIKTVFASRGKWTRAEPVAALFQQGRCHLVGIHAKLEDQLTSFDPFEGQKSPDRLDGMVWGLTELMLKSGTRFFL